MADRKRIRVIVGGRVQGVGFRYYTQREGERLGLVGWVKNLPNGGVEVEAEGGEDKVALFVEAVRQGPSSSRVIDFQMEQIPVTHREVAFDIRMF